MSKRARLGIGGERGEAPSRDTGAIDGQQRVGLISPEQIAPLFSSEVLIRRGIARGI